MGLVGLVWEHGVVDGGGNACLMVSEKDEEHRPVELAQLADKPFEVTIRGVNAREVFIEFGRL